MTLKEKMELLVSKKSEAEEMRKSAEKISIEIKSLDASSEEFETKSEEAEKLIDDIKGIDEEIVCLEKDIEAEQKKLEETAAATKIKNQKEKGAIKMDYLNSKEAVKDFAEILAKGLDGKEVKKAWMEKLTEKGLSNPDALLPAALVTEIQNAATEDAEIYNTFNHTGLTMFKNAIDTGDGRAHGHKKGQAKAEETITLATKEIRAQYIYKYLTLDKEIVREQKDTNALIKYVAKELVQRIYNEITRAAIIGDGRSSSANDKINKFEAIASATSTYTTSANATSNFYEDLVNLVGSIVASGSKYIVMSRANLTALKLAKDGAGSYIFTPGTDIASILGVEKIFTPSWMDAEATIKAVAYNGASYKLVGDKAFESFEDFTLAQNKNEFLMETYQGGALADAKSGAVLKISA